MRKLLFIIMIAAISLWAVAGNITPEEALQQAIHFLQEKAVKNGGQHRAVPASQLVAAGKVNGLYVFNVAEEGGFVIVSNDDRTFPILGYGNSGAFDVLQMPDNMRVWLQGYADEIAWLQQHGGCPKEVPSKISHRTLKTPIAPLIASRWNQGAPYNNLCPDYQTNRRSVTGCVATAMAQVMNYHQWPAATTAEIPGYTTGAYKIVMPAIPAGSSIDWTNMRNVYEPNIYSETEAMAVAELMLYCGTSVLMNYGPSSGSYSFRVADALKSYYDYNITTKCISRSFYSYGDWIEIMYHELSQNRPIVYGGQSTTAGHEFVVDGYDSEDYFHINWGWGGSGDNYFKLSVLDPAQLGIGGGSSLDGYHFGQDAVIGIQKSTDTGTILDIEPYTVSLEILDVTFSEDPTQGETVDVNFNIRNRNVTDAYDGDIGMRVFCGDTQEADLEKTFLIPAGQTKVCTLSFVPASSGAYKVRPHRPSSPGYFFWMANPYDLEINSPIEAVNDITLDCEQHIENCDVNARKFYGNIFKGSIVYTNNTDENYRGALCAYLSNETEGGMLGRSYKTYTIKAHTSVNIPIEVSELTYGNAYQLVSYYKKKGVSSYTYSKVLTCTPGVVYYDIEGNGQVVSPDGILKVPNNVQSINLTGVDVNEVIPNSNPNCLYILDSGATVPTGIAGNNIIRYDGNAYTAENISLSDGKDFYSPVAFTAENMEFTYEFTVGANGRNGWNTIILPFDVVQITADDVPIDWFHSSNDSEGRFWVKEFTGDAATSVSFDYVPGTMMYADTPYIIALPGSYWGNRYDLSSKTIKFIAANNSMVYPSRASSLTGDNYRFVGQTYAGNAGNVFTLNANGSQFVLTNENVGAFRAYFKPDTYDRNVRVLTIDSSSTTGVTTIDVLSKPSDGYYYNLNGQRVKTPMRGIYIKNGKKIMINSNDAVR